MGGFTGRICFEDNAHMNPKLRPPSLLGVLFCLISMFCFIITVTAFAFSSLSMYLSFALIVLYTALGTSENSAWERKYPSMTLLVPIFVGSALLPFFIGLKINVKIYAPYYLAKSGREYKNVPATARTAEYADAGIIFFQDDATLDTSRAFGYRGEDFTYCVAPVISRQASVHPLSAGPKITFWAVGEDCCGKRREFECDGAGEMEVASGFTVRDVPHSLITRYLVPNTHRPEYLKAVQGAKAIHNLRSEDEDKVILVRWASDPKDTLEVWNNRAVVAVIVAIVLYSVIIIVAWSSIHSYYDRDIRRIAGMRDSTGKTKDPFMLGGGP